MNRFPVVAVLMLGLLAPLQSLAGGGGPPPDVPGQKVAPTFDAVTGNSGIMVQAASGFTFGYNMSGLATVGSGTLPVVPAGSTLSVNDDLGSPDFDGNGVNDIAITNADGSQVGYLLQDDGDFVSVLASGALPVLPPGYSLIGWPDLNGDGNSDMVMQHTGGYTVAYLMTGLTAGPATALPSLQTGLGYSTIGFPDLDGVNGADIVWQHSGGYTVAYLLDSALVSTQGILPSLQTGLGYSTIGFPDLDGAAGADIVWQHSGGYTVAFLLQGTTAGGITPLPSLLTANGYQTLGFPDLDANNGADIVWQHSGGYTYAFLLDATQTPTDQGALPSLQTGLGYSTIGGPNLDSLNGQDIVWQHVDGYTFAYLLNGLTAVASGPVPGLPDPVSGYVTVEWDNAW